MNHLSLELSRHLSSLAPGFEGHYEYYEIEIASDLVEVRCREKQNSIFEENSYPGKFICPAWQAEDVLRNSKIIGDKIPKSDPEFKWHHAIINGISRCFQENPDIAYQKIEEYLWTILK